MSDTPQIVRSIDPSVYAAAAGAVAKWAEIPDWLISVMVNATVDAVRALPAAERMETMGMEDDGILAYDGERTYVEGSDSYRVWREAVPGL